MNVISISNNFKAGQCFYNGKTYFDGDSFPDEDDCNTCKCVDGGVLCSKKFCPPNGKFTEFM